MNNTQSSEDRIEDLEDQIHDLKLQLKHERETRIALQREYEEIAKEPETRKSDEELLSQRVADEVSTIRTSIQIEYEKNRAEYESRAKHAAQHATESERELRRKLVKSLAIAEMIACGNLAFFDTTDGAELIYWCQRELAAIKKGDL